jgi:hypothetical protein
MIKNIATQIADAYNAKWSMVNNFTIQITFGSKLLSAAGVNSYMFEPKAFNLVCKGMDLPQLAYSPIESYQGGQYKMTQGKPEAIRFGMHFRDKDQLGYFRAFRRLWQAQKYLYLDEIGIQVHVYKDPDYYNEKDLLVEKYTKCQIESVSSLQYSQDTEAQITEFQVQFKCPAAQVL